jgi:hypothetical protein
MVKQAIWAGHYSRRTKPINQRAESELGSRKPWVFSSVLFCLKIVVKGIDPIFEAGDSVNGGTLPLWIIDHFEAV